MQAGMLGFFVLFLVPFFYLLSRTPHTLSTVLRPIAAYDSLKRLLARAAETGQPVHISVGTAGISDTRTADTVAGLYVLEFLADRAAVSDIPPVVSVTEPTALPAVQEELRRAYERQGYPEDYNPLQARFIAPPVNGSAVPYAAGVMQLLSQEPVMANVMVGAFGDEYLLITEPCAQRELVQVGGASNPSILPLVYLTTSQPLLGEEIYAAGAYLSQRVGHLASLSTQDFFRFVLLVLILLGVLAHIVGLL